MSRPTPSRRQMRRVARVYRSWSRSAARERDQLTRQEWLEATRLTRRRQQHESRRRNRVTS